MSSINCTVACSTCTFPDPKLPSTNASTSYWLEPADEVLRGHRTTAAIPESADIVIIGSGIAGAQTARYLYEQDDGKWLNGKKVVMLEAREACWGATGRNGGHCKPSLYHYPELHSSAIRNERSEDVLTRIRFELENLEALASYIETNSIPCNFHKVPACDAFFDQASFDLAVGSIQTLQQDAPDLAAHLRIVTDREELRSELRVPSAVGAVIFPAAKLWPYKLVSWILKDLIQTKGLNLQTLTPVIGVSTLNPDSPIPLHRIHTDRGSIVTPIVIHATNAFASHLLPQLRDCIYPVRAQMSALKPPSSMIKTPLKYTYGLVDGEVMKAEYLVQADIHGEEGGELLLGGGRKYASCQGVGVTNDYGIDKDVATYLRTSVGRLFKDECGYTQTEGRPEKECIAKFEWTGIMGFSADQKPWVGKVVDSPEGQYLLAGFEGHGMSLATGSALGLVQIIHHRYPTFPENPYSANWHQTIVMAMHSFNPSKDGDCKLARFNKGDVLDIQERASNGWWFGKVVSSKGLSTQTTEGGWFPSNYVANACSFTDVTADSELTSSVISRLKEYPPKFDWFPTSFLITQARIDDVKSMIDGRNYLDVVSALISPPTNLQPINDLIQSPPRTEEDNCTRREKTFLVCQLAKLCKSVATLIRPILPPEVDAGDMNREATIAAVTEIYLETMKMLTSSKNSPPVAPRMTNDASDNAIDSGWEVI